MATVRFPDAHGLTAEQWAEYWDRILPRYRKAMAAQQLKRDFEKLLTPKGKLRGNR